MYGPWSIDPMWRIVNYCEPGLDVLGNQSLNLGSGANYKGGNVDFMFKSTVVGGYLN